ncbi:hypothetical protein RZN05_05025 [Sphingomonas sp. HF-S4]|uniref:Uncharacterized protein n=1 Tax=Sphingomonas agrestis TaxID=3080540 RepID=A0ABU3Y558_9SPHN|nr:hypothetical protein [Sphingomonas sp. HF-S4]MDV3456337.1 hypothetical protein [Sphingomonas sp. HF-S4]
MVDIVLSVTLESAGDSSATEALSSLVAGLDAKSLRLSPATVKAGRKRSTVTDAEELAAAITALPDSDFSIAFESDPNAFFDGVAGAARASLNLGFAGESPLPRDGTVSGIAAALADTARSGTVGVGAYSGLSIRNLDFARARPPRDYLVAGQTGLIDVVNLKAGGADDAAAQVFGTVDLPPGVERTVAEDIAVVDWSADAALDDAEKLAERLALRDRWLVEHAVGRAAEGWHDSGDAIVDPVDARPEDGLTLYSPSMGVGYVAIHSAASADERKQALAAAAKLREQGKTATGAQLGELVLVADTREAAVALRSEAAASGLNRVVYASDEHMLDPFPEGSWVEAPEREA